MRTKTKVWLVIATFLVLIGCILFGSVMSVLKWDFTKLSTVKYESNTYEISESYKDISIIANTADIVFAPSENQTTVVSCYEQKNIKHSVSVKDGTLVIDVVNTRKWHEHIGIAFDTPKITVFIPQGEHSNLSVKSTTGDVEIPKEFTFKSMDISKNTGSVKCYASALEEVKIKATTGSIYIKDTSAGSLDLAVSTGKVTVSGVTCERDIAVLVSTGKTQLSNVRCKNVTSSGSTGDISLEKVVAAETFSVKRSTGDVTLNSSDATAISIKTDTGDVTGTLLTDKVFITKTDTGNINVPDSITGGRCEITTNTGDIQIRIV